MASTRLAARTYAHGTHNRGDARSWQRSHGHTGSEALEACGISRQKGQGGFRSREASAGRRQQATPMRQLRTVTWLPIACLPSMSTPTSCAVAAMATSLAKRDEDAEGCGGSGEVHTEFSAVIPDGFTALLAGKVTELPWNCCSTTCSWKSQMLWDTGHGQLELSNGFVRFFVGLAGGNIDAVQRDDEVDERCKEIVVGAGGRELRYHARLLGEDGLEELEVVHGTCGLVRGPRGTSLVSRPAGITLSRMNPTRARLTPAMEAAGWVSFGGDSWGAVSVSIDFQVLAHACLHAHAQTTSTCPNDDRAIPGPKRHARSPIDTHDRRTLLHRRWATRRRTRAETALSSPRR
jgi:hypothetical protein